MSEYEAFAAVALSAAMPVLCLALLVWSVAAWSRRSDPPAGEDGPGRPPRGPRPDGPHDRPDRRQQRRQTRFHARRRVRR